MQLTRTSMTAAVLLNKFITAVSTGSGTHDRPRHISGWPIERRQTTTCCPMAVSRRILHKQQGANVNSICHKYASPSRGNKNSISDYYYCHTKKEIGYLVSRAGIADSWQILTVGRQKRRLSVRVVNRRAAPVAEFLRWVF